MKAKVNKIDDDLRPQYDFDYSKAVRGKYFKRLLEEGANVVVLEPDVSVELQPEKVFIHLPLFIKD